MGNPVVHFEISSKDFEKSQAFYRDLFAWNISRAEGMPYFMVQGEGPNSIGGGIGPARDDQPPGLTFYVQVDDLQAYLEKAESLGGKTIMSPSPIPEIGSFAVFADPDGIVIGLYKALDK